MNRYSVVFLSAVVLAGCQVFWSWTNGLRTYTAEGARRLVVRERPIRLPDVTLEDSGQHVFGLDAYRGDWVLVDFIYTRCPTICSSLGQTFKRIAAELRRSGMERRVSLLSISFDKHDTPAALQNYGRIYDADGRFWRVARVEDENELARLLETFGVVVIPNEFGGYDHNAAVHLVDPEGFLVRIYDYDAIGQIVNDLRSIS